MPHRHVYVGRAKVPSLSQNAFFFYDAIWQAKQLEVGKINGEARHREPELMEVCKKSVGCDAQFQNLPGA